VARPESWNLEGANETKFFAPASQVIRELSRNVDAVTE